MTLIDNIVRDLLVADPKMKTQELLDHCIILGTHNGLSEHEVREQLQTCEQYRQTSITEINEEQQQLDQVEEKQNNTKSDRKIGASNET